MTDAEDDPFAGVEDGLLETDIGEKSYNKAPWRTSNNSSARATDKLILHNTKENQDPLVGLSIADSSELLEAVRSSCDSCGASRRYFCYGCRRSLSSTARFIPRVSKLPLKVDVVKHGGELDGKVIKFRERTINENTLKACHLLLEHSRPRCSHMP